MTSRPPLPPFAYEYRYDPGNWHRAYGNENCDFDEQGLMLARHPSINELPITSADRKFHWEDGPTNAWA